jgi:hypothetical protein
MPIRRSVVLAIGLVALCAPAPAAAAWNQVTASDGANIDQVSTARTADGVLHVAWLRKTGPNTMDLLHTVIAPNGAIGATNPIQAGWAVVENPALVVVPGGLRVFWGGIRTTNPSETNTDLNTALSTDGGASWALQPGSVVPVGGQAYGSPVAASVLPNGTPLEAWAGTLGTWVHSGLSPASPNFNYQAPLGNYGYDTGIATDAAGRTVLAWYSNATGHLGLFAQDVAADGSPVGSAANMPDTSNMQIGPLGRTPIVARVGGGFYTAFATGYPALDTVRVWRVGSGQTARIARGLTSATASIAAAPDGRLWVVWKTFKDGKPAVYAARSNKAATRWGASVALRSPAGASSSYRVDANATSSAAQVFATFTQGTAPGVATWTTLTAPGLSLSASPSSLRRGRHTEVEFKVSDAGDAVAGAKVSGGGKSDTTDAGGKASLTLTGRGKRVHVTVTRAGYVAGAVNLRVRR